MRQKGPEGLAEGWSFTLGRTEMGPPVVYWPEGDGLRMALLLPQLLYTLSSLLKVNSLTSLILQFYLLTFYSQTLQFPEICKEHM